MMESDDFIQHLIVASLEGTASDEELEKLRQWLEESEAHWDEYGGMRRQWLRTGAGERYEVERGWRSVKKRLSGRKAMKGRWVMRRWWEVAAAAVVLLLAGGIWHWTAEGLDGERGGVDERIVPGGKKAVLVLGSNEQVVLGDGAEDAVWAGNAEVRREENTLVYAAAEGDTAAVEYNRLITPRGGEYTVVLADGTQVWVNADSELKYPVRFSGGERKVYLKGEAYFDVAKRDGQKFVVCTNGTEVTVLGTEFNVKNYPGGGMATTLVEGSVVIGHGGQECRLRPGQQAYVDRTGVQVREVETVLYTAWKDGFFVYRDMTLDGILKELSRWYDFSYFYRNERLQALPLTAKIRKFDDVEKVFEILKSTGQVDFVIKGKTVTVLSK